MISEAELSYLGILTELPVPENDRIIKKGAGL